MDTKPINPLAKHFRRPAIYFKLPSNGRYWPEDSLEMPANGEIPVFPMTNADEITLKTPDALMNGEGMAAMLASCCPSIKDPWVIPSTDINALLVAARIASYGHNMEFETKCPNCGNYNIVGDTETRKLTCLTCGYTREWSELNCVDKTEGPK